MDTTRHNGFKNYVTFLVALNIDSTQFEQEYWQYEAGVCRAETNTAEDAVEMLARLLEGEHEDHIETYNLVGFAADLMSAAMGDVNWYEIAEHLLSD